MTSIPRIGVISRTVMKALSIDVSGKGDMRWRRATLLMSTALWPKHTHTQWVNTTINSTTHLLNFPPWQHFADLNSWHSLINLLWSGTWGWDWSRIFLASEHTQDWFMTNVSPKQSVVVVLFHCLNCKNIRFQCSSESWSWYLGHRQGRVYRWYCPAS